MRQQTQNLVYYYASGDEIARIYKEGVIKISPINLKRKEKRQAVWLSGNQEWEPTVALLLKDETTNILPPFSIISDATEEEFQEDLLARIVIKWTPSLLDWREFKKVSDLPKHIFRDIERHAIEVGSELGERKNLTFDWFASLRDIPYTEWIAIEATDPRICNDWHPFKILDNVNMGALNINLN